MSSPRWPRFLREIGIVGNVNPRLQTSRTASDVVNLPAGWPSATSAPRPYISTAPTRRFRGIPSRLLAADVAARHSGTYDSVTGVTCRVPRKHTCSHCLRLCKQKSTRGRRACQTRKRLTESSTSDEDELRETTSDTKAQETDDEEAEEADSSTELQSCRSVCEREHHCRHQTRCRRGGLTAAARAD